MKLNQACFLAVAFCLAPAFADADEPAVVFDVDTKTTVEEHLEYLGSRVVDELRRYEIDVDNVELGADHAVVEIRNDDDLDLSYRLLTRVSAQDLVPVAPLNEAMRERLAGRGELADMERWRKQRMEQLAKNLPRDPFTVSRNDEALIITPLEGDLEFESERTRKDAVAYISTLLRSGGLAEATRVEVSDGRIHVFSTAAQDDVIEALSATTTFAMHLAQEKQEMVAGKIDASGDLLPPQTVTKLDVDPEPFVTAKNVWSVRPGFDGGDVLVAVIALDHEGTEALARATSGGSFSARVITKVGGVVVSEARLYEPILNGRLQLPLDGTREEVEAVIALLRASAGDDGVVPVTTTQNGQASPAPSAQ